MNRRLRPASPFWKVSGKGQRGNCFWKVSGEIAPLCLRSPASPVLYNNEPLLQSSMTLTTSHCYEAQSRQQRTERQKVCSQDIPRGRLHPSGREGITPQPITTVKAGLLNQSQLWRQHPSTNHKLWRKHSSTNDNSEGSTPQPITTHVSGLSLLSRDQLAVHLLLFGELANPLLLYLLLDGDITTGGSVDRGRHGWATSLSDKGNKRDVTYPSRQNVKAQGATREWRNAARNYTVLCNNVVSKMSNQSFQKELVQ